MKKNILIVDDEISQNNILKEILEDIYNVEQCDNIPDAIHLIQLKKYNLCISDLNISSKHSGLALCKKIRIINPSIKILIITAEQFIDEKILKDNDYYIIKKPFSMHALLNFCEKII
jgi:DNA-binding NtrC family response regulator